ncbi:MAG: glycosyltransferase [Oscillospiraceae bacterium]
MPQISVIIPVYKVEDYLERCVKSVLNQTFDDIEVILVDDGSPDRCGEICDAFAEKDNRVRTIHKKNGGLSSARNAGLDIAKGEYFAFIDSDDWVDIDMLELMLRVAQEKNADIVECSFRNVFSDRITEETTCTAQIIEASPLEALEGMLDWKTFKALACNKLYRRYLFENLRFTNGVLHEDEFITYKLFWKCKRLAYLDVSKYNYDHTRENAITSSFKDKNCDAVFAMWERIAFFRDNDIITLKNKMDHLFCWVLFETIYKCHKFNACGENYKTVCDNLPQYCAYLDNCEIDKYYKEQIAALRRGMTTFLKYRKEHQ